MIAHEERRRQAEERVLGEGGGASKEVVTCKCGSQPLTCRKILRVSPTYLVLPVHLILLFDEHFSKARGAYLPCSDTQGPGP